MRKSLRCSPSISMIATLTTRSPDSTRPSFTVTQTRLALGSASLLQSLTHGEKISCGSADCAACCWSGAAGGGAACCCCCCGGGCCGCACGLAAGLGGGGFGFGWAGCGCGGAWASDTDTAVTANRAPTANAASALLAVRADAD